MNKQHIEIHLAADTEGNPNKAHAALERLLRELPWQLPEKADLFVKQQPDLRTVSLLTEREIGIGGGGFITVTDLLITFLNDKAVVLAVVSALTTVIIKFIERNKDAEVTIEYNGKKVTVRGENYSKATSLLARLFPDLDVEPKSAAESRIDNLLNEFPVSDVDPSHEPAADD